MDNKGKDIKQLVFSNRPIRTYDKANVLSSQEAFDYFFEKCMLNILKELRLQDKITSAQYKSARGNIYRKIETLRFIRNYNLDMDKIYKKIEKLSTDYIFIKAGDTVYKISEIQSMANIDYSKFINEEE